MDVAEALRLGDRNLGDYVRLLAESAGGQWDEADGLVLFAGAHAYPGTHTNGILRLDAALPAEAALSRADAFFKARKRSYTVWIRDTADADLEAAVQARGFELRPPEGGMGVILHDGPFDLAEHPVSPDAELRTFADEEVRRDYVRIVGRSFGVEGVPVETLARLFFDPASLADPRVLGLRRLRRRDGRLGVPGLRQRRLRRPVLGRDPATGPRPRPGAGRPCPVRK